MHTNLNSEPALPLRSDTMLGICEALGQDFGFHANWLRLALGSIVLFSPMAAFGIYLGLGIIVAFSRLVAPQGRVQRIGKPRLASSTPHADNEEAEAVAIAA